MSGRAAYAREAQLVTAERTAVPQSTRSGEVLAGRYRLLDLLNESGDGRFWRAHDAVLGRHVAIHVIAEDDARAEGLLGAARCSATLVDARLLRVLDAESTGGICYVVNEWGDGISLSTMLANAGPLPPRRAAWLVAEVAETIARAHDRGIAHGRLVPENVLVDQAGAVRILGFSVDAALHGTGPGRAQDDVVDLAGLLHCALTGGWAGASESALPRAPESNGRVLRPRQVRAGVPRLLDDLCDQVLHPQASRPRSGRDIGGARDIERVLVDFVGDPAGLAEALAAGLPPRTGPVVLTAMPDLTLPAPAPAGPPHAGPPPAGATPGTGRAVPPPTTPDQPTEAGLPIFGDQDDDVSWLRARSERAAPPPPFDEPPERPLFAPAPVGDQPTRHTRPAPPSVVEDDPDYWPWHTGSDLQDTGATTASGPAEDMDAPPGRVPGRRSMRAAALVAVALVVLIVVVLAHHLFSGRPTLGADPSSRAGSSSIRGVDPGVSTA